MQTNCTLGSAPSHATWTLWGAAAAQNPQWASYRQVTTPTLSPVACAALTDRQHQSEPQSPQMSQLSSRSAGLRRVGVRVQVSSRKKLQVRLMMQPWVWSGKNYRSSLHGNGIHASLQEYNMVLCVRHGYSWQCFARLSHLCSRHPAAPRDTQTPTSLDANRFELRQVAS